MAIAFFTYCLLDKLEFTIKSSHNQHLLKIYLYYWIKLLYEIFVNVNNKLKTKKYKGHQFNYFPDMVITPGDAIENGITCL